jgi:hypothetical protein
VAAGLLALLVSACGGSSHVATTRSKSTTTSTTSASSAGPGGSSVSTGPVRATLTGQNHRPVEKRNWTYRVRATDPQGHPLSGTVETEFAFGGTVVGKETPPVHKLKDGRLADTLQFPPMAVGYPIELQVVVRTPAGSVTLDWPVKVQR